MLTNLAQNHQQDKRATSEGQAEERRFANPRNVHRRRQQMQESQQTDDVNDSPGTTAQRQEVWREFTQCDQAQRQADVQQCVVLRLVRPDKPKAKLFQNQLAVQDTGHEHTEPRKAGLL